MEREEEIEQERKRVKRENDKQERAIRRELNKHKPKEVHFGLAIT